MEPISYWIHKRAVITPERIAIIDEKKKYSYRALSKEILAMAAMIQSKYSLQKGNRVAILSQNSADYIVTYFAIAHLGLVAVPLNIRLSASELAFQLGDSGAQVIFYTKETEHLLNGTLKQAKIENAYLMGENLDYSLVVKNLSAIDAKNDPYIICYTSGTTGRPKGAVLTQENMFWNALNNQYAIDLHSEDKVIVLLPLFHIGGIGLFAFGALLAGATIIIPDKFDAGNAIAAIGRHRISIVMGVPTMLEAIRKSPAFPKADFSSVRWFYSGGAPCPENLIEAYLERGLRLGQGMGMTETSPTIFMLSKEDYERKKGSIGKPVLFCDIEIVDENGRPVKTGDVGELIIKGPNVMQGYWGLEDETENAIRNGWFYSGDLMKQDEEGFVYIAGRKKEMIISGGENIYPLEVELVLVEIPQINESAVIGVADDNWGEVPVAFISYHGGGYLEEEEIRNYCSVRLAKYKVPKIFHVLDNLPKNATGKIDKKELGRLLPR